MGRLAARISIIAAMLLLAACQAPQLGPVGSIAPSGPQIPAAQRISTNMEVGAVAEAPSGYLAFCRRDPEDCAVGDDDAEQVVLTPDAWTRLALINTTVNGAIKPMEDAIHYGRVDYWTIPVDGYGDCEDYALAKRKALAGAGFSRRALRLAVAELPSGEAHAVLTVATDQGDFVLDNRIDLMLPWAETKLVWLARQSADLRSWTGFSVRRSLLLALR